MTNKKTEDQEEKNLDGKMTIQFGKTDLSTSPIIGNIYEGKVSILNTATAKRFIDMGHAKQVPHGTKSLEKVDAVESDDDEEENDEDLVTIPELKDYTNDELKSFLTTVEGDFKANTPKKTLIEDVEANKEKFVAIAEDLGIEVPEDAETAIIINLIEVETAQ